MPTDTPVLMHYDQIRLTADDDHNDFRVRRLERLVGYVQALADIVSAELLLDKVEAIHDHEGMLTITWKQAPTEIEQQIFYKGWDSRVCDGGDSRLTTEHLVAG